MARAQTVHHRGKNCGVSNGNEEFIWKQTRDHLCYILTNNLSTHFVYPETFVRFYLNLTEGILRQLPSGYCINMVVAFGHVQLEQEQKQGGKMKTLQFGF